MKRRKGGSSSNNSTNALTVEDDEAMEVREEDDSEWTTEDDDDRTTTQQTRESIADFRARGGKQWKKLLEVEAEMKRKEQLRRQALGKLRSGGKGEK